MDMKSLLNIHAFNSLVSPVERPNVNLGVGKDENHKSIPLLIFTEQHLPMPKPEVIPTNKLSYEKVQIKGANNSLDLSDFETQAFSVGGAFGGV